LLVPPGGSASVVSILGIPLRLGAITPGRCDLAPKAIRAALAKFSTYDSDLDRDLSAPWADYGDLDVAQLKPAEAMAPVAERVYSVAKRTSSAVVLLGGDNSVTRPGVAGIRRAHPSCGLITLDAHHDLREVEHGLTNGNPIRALLLDGFPGDSIIQLGLQPFANSRVYAGFARSQGIRFLTASECAARGGAEAMCWALKQLASACDAVYIDFDIDVLDRAHAISGAGSRPGGMSMADALAAIGAAGRDQRVKAIDIVEHNPEKDIADLTSYSAALCLLRFVSEVSARNE
jgi:formiminoglutamase